MCNRYATYGETNALHGALKSLELDWADETPLRPADIYPDQDAQIVRQIGDELALVEARWGFPEIKKGAGVITNIRNLASPWWQRVNRPYLLEPEYRCLVYPLIDLPNHPALRPGFPCPSRHFCGCLAALSGGTPDGDSG